MSKFPGSRNFGYGKQMDWAGRQALTDHYGFGHFSSVEAHFSRWRQFCRWARSTHGVRDARDIVQAVVDEYAGFLTQQVKEETVAVAYAQNLLSSINVTLEAMRGTSMVRVTSPSEWVGERDTVRRDPPTGYDWQQVDGLVSDLRLNGLLRAAAVVELCRSFGLRLREAVLGDGVQWQRQAEKGAIDIREGTKGGRGKEVERLVPVSDRGRRALANTMSVRGLLGCGDNLLRPEETYDGFVNSGEIHRARRYMHGHGIKGYHDLRAAWACERFEEISGQPAPVFKPILKLTHSKYYHVRVKLCQELGHDRMEVAAEYIGARAI